MAGSCQSLGREGAPGRAIATSTTSMAGSCQSLGREGHHAGPAGAAMSVRNWMPGQEIVAAAA
ncbi:MAG: hypothetical protein QOG43_2235 [Actinomycetota bacterium]|jgi:hypothetical protein|nr:hypothetical protein [Actinomycetota bacterium]